MGNLLLTWFDPLRVNNPKWPTGFVNGQFLLIRSDAYHRIDGHRAVRHFIIEDIPFGQHAKTNGVTLRVLEPAHESDKFGCTRTWRKS